MTAKLFYNRGKSYPRILLEEDYKECELNNDLSVRLLRLSKKHGIRTTKRLLALKTVTAQKWYGFGPRTMEELLDWKLQKIREINGNSKT